MQGASGLIKTTRSWNNSWIVLILFDRLRQLLIGGDSWTEKDQVRLRISRYVTIFESYQSELSIECAGTVSDSTCN